MKFIVGIMLAVFIAAGAGLIIPQFLGIDVTVVQETTVSNQKVGTAVYSKKEDVSSLAAGQKILELDTNKLNVLTVTDYNAESGVITVTGGTGQRPSPEIISMFWRQCRLSAFCQSPRRA